MPQFSITSEINVNTLRDDSDNFYKLLTRPADLVALAERFGWVSVDHLASELCIRKVARDCWDVTGHITGQIVQSCIVTGTPVPENIDFRIEERYVRTAKQIDWVEVDLDGVEPLILENWRCNHWALRRLHGQELMMRQVATALVRTNWITHLPCFLL